jgi:hypothetical protein
MKMISYVAKGGEQLNQRTMRGGPKQPRKAFEEEIAMNMSPGGEGSRIVSDHASTWRANLLSCSLGLWVHFIL